MAHDHLLLLLFVCTLLCYNPRGCESWGWFSSSKESQLSQTFSPNAESETFKGSVAEFSMEGLNNPKGIKLVEIAKHKLVTSNSCWQNAYRNLFVGCSEILAVNEKKSRLAWHLSDCFQRDSGRPPFPQCGSKSSMAKCLKNLDDLAHKVYLEFYIETNTICHQLQAHAFKHDTERLVNELRRSAQFVEDKLETIDERSEHLLQDSRQISDSLNIIDARTQQVVHTAKTLGDQIGDVLTHSEVVYEQTKSIAASQSLLPKGQEEMKKNMEEGLEVIRESYDNFGEDIVKLRDEAVVIEKEIGKVGDAMSDKMKLLQNKAEDIGNMAGISLDKQQLLIEGQSNALEGLQTLSKFQSEALGQSKETLQHLAEYSHRQQEELLRRQEQIQKLHNRLMESSKSILAAQESFELKQGSMFDALDKLFALHNAMLVESRVIKASIIYFLSIFVIYMFTSTKQTHTARPWLYIGLCATLLIEVIIIRFTSYENIDQQTLMMNTVRSFSALAASGLLLYAIFTYRNYEVLNHQMLQILMDKVNDMQRQELSYDSDSEVNWSSWIDTELRDDIKCLEDPDYVLPENVGENSVTSSTSTRNYNLRNRNHRR